MQYMGIGKLSVASRESIHVSFTCKDAERASHQNSARKSPHGLCHPCEALIIIVDLQGKACLLGMTECANPPCFQEVYGAQVHYGHRGCTPCIMSGVERKKKRPDSPPQLLLSCGSCRFLGMPWDATVIDH